MSDTVRSYGFIAVLATPFITMEEREAFCEKLWDAKSILDVNYEGTLVYIDYDSHADYATRTNIYHTHFGGVTPHGRPTDLVEEAAKYKLEIQPETLRFYSCVWYNGSDCPLDEMTKAAFLAHTSQPAES